MKFGMAVALKRKNMELWNNGGGTAALAENSRNFLPFLAKLNNFESF